MMNQKNPYVGIIRIRCGKISRVSSQPLLQHPNEDTNLMFFSDNEK